MAVDLVALAAEVRTRAGEVSPAFSTNRMVAAWFPDALVAGRVLPAGVLEAVARTPDGPVIIYARGLPSPAHRFAIAHAMAHLLLDGDDAFRQPGQRLERSCEVRADAFADELLVPLDVLASHVDRWPSADPVEHEIYLDMVDAISSRFGVLAEVIDRRIRALVR